MANAAKYSAVGILRDGRQLQIRAQRPDDQAAIMSAVERTSAQSLFRRFFAVKRYFSSREIEFFTNVDFINHVALVAVIEENGGPMIVGGGRYVVVQPGKAEVAFTVVDQYQGKGIGTQLMHHLITIARESGLTELNAEVLPDNHSMLRVLEKSGMPRTAKRDAGITHVVLQLGRLDQT
jgi:RimJ/RimL family protein N-acetyltransferase